MVAGVFARTRPRAAAAPFHHRIDDDVSGTSIDYDPSFDIEFTRHVPASLLSGSVRTVRSAANKNNQDPGIRRGLHAQGYFVYDSKKSGSQTESHLRFGPDPIRAPYLAIEPISLAATSSGSSTRSTCWVAPLRVRRCC